MICVIKGEVINDFVTVSRLLLKPPGKMDFSKVRKTQGLSQTIKVELKNQDLGRKPKEW